MTEPTPCRRQAGATLIVGLIMLILMTLLAISAFRLSNTNLKIVGNEQIRKEAEAAAVYAFDAAANTSTFASATGPTTTTVNVGMANYNVTISKPDCKRYRVIPKSELVVVSGGIPVVAPNDVACFTGSSSSPLTIVSTNSAVTEGESLCAATLWELQASVVPAASDVNTGVMLNMAEGLEQRLTVPDAQSSCN
ncbi:PilX N-terminal domain-containing pilus assembly protein [Propionivibrio sp.]|uniref:PilX N-terminal domain-containing pilus assembly protein n=1 Tax=Propionivibrio sp. TaxID=2212460 RepID=UPI00272EBEEF|nr:PilX N-terminal domain-containing pilus assembly protein [Propionivibrio sp.]